MFVAGLIVGLVVASIFWCWYAWHLGRDKSYAYYLDSRWGDANRLPWED